MDREELGFTAWEARCLGALLIQKQDLGRRREWGRNDLVLGLLGWKSLAEIWPSANVSVSACRAWCSNSRSSRLWDLRNESVTVSWSV